jgi:2-C-methyl-D-erythritol 4-phosphate cytidylyltransferase
MKKFSLIVAGGSGVRMGGEVPKQFMVLSEKPVLMHTLEAFYSYDPDIRIILVIPESHFGYWEELCRQYRFQLPHTRIAGGNTRFHSVKNGLGEIPEEGIVFIHDGVRPLIGRSTLLRCEELARQKGNAVPVIPASESVRWTDGDITRPLDRSRVMLVQTPQTFRVSLIKEAYGQPFTDEFTDDASVLEKAGYQIFLTEGNRENIKITWPYDLYMADAVMKSQARR